MSSTKAINSNFDSSEQVPFLGGTISKGVKDFSDEVINDVIPGCLEYQSNILNCAPQIEIRAAKELVAEQIEDLSSGLGGDSLNRLTLAKSEYDRCVAVSYTHLTLPTKA